MTDATSDRTGSVLLVQLNILETISKQQFQGLQVLMKFSIEGHFKMKCIYV